MSSSLATVYAVLFTCLCSLVIINCSDDQQGRNELRNFEKSIDSKRNTINNLTGISLRGSEHTYWPTNLALRRPVYQSSTYQSDTHWYQPSNAVDGNSDPNVYHGHCSITNDATPGSPNWLVVDLQNDYYVRFVVLTNGYNPNLAFCADRLNYFLVGLTMNFSPVSNPPVRGKYSLCGQYPSTTPAGARLTQWCQHPLIRSRYVIIQQPANGIGYLSICELEVYGEKASIKSTV